MSKLTKNERLVLSVLPNRHRNQHYIFKQLRKLDYRPSVDDLEILLNSLEQKGYAIEDKKEGWKKKPSKVKTIIASVLLLAFGAFLLSGPFAVVVWIWQTAFTVAAKYAASYGVFMLTVVWFGYLFKWSEMMQNRYDGSE